MYRSYLLIEKQQAENSVQSNSI